MTNSGTCWRWYLGIAVGGAMVFGANCAVAQITPDGTLPTNVQLNGSVFNITGGTRAGGNLFHSFREFSVPTGGEAFFNNAVDIQNIISRVTGGSISNIDGSIRSHGTANLFLINPSGIVFGQNARLNVGGSFVASTANAVEFGSQGVFSATNPEAPPLLTVNPSALLFSQISGGRIENRGGLNITDGRSLLLVGGEVFLDGGYVNALGGRVELAGIRSPGTVGLNVNDNNLSLSVSEGVPRANVSLTNHASVQVASISFGQILAYQLSPHSNQNQP
ncbi:filamentous hemagglutinin N-terminal domain-containing protein [Nostoc sp. CHAB 5844]|nr:filamentous hemagglutinin N-terminal domain-containing protein [Nostoc sp. CHAB 5844]